MDESEEVEGAPFVACGEASEVIEFVEASFDAVAASIDKRIMRDRFRSGEGGRNDHLGADVGDEAAQGIGIIGSVGKNSLSRIE